MGNHRGRWLSLLFFFLPLLASACGEAPVAYFHPNSALAPHAPQTAQAAVLVYAGDVGYLFQAGAVVLGSVRVDAPEDTQYEDRARVAGEIAAQSGGTHMVLQQTDMYDSGGGAQVGLTPGLWAASGTQGSAYRYEVFSIYRVPSESWGQLPPPLRPQRFAAAK